MTSEQCPDCGHHWSNHREAGECMGPDFAAVTWPGLCSCQRSPAEAGGELTGGGDDPSEADAYAPTGPCPACGAPPPRRATFGWLMCGHQVVAWDARLRSGDVPADFGDGALHP